MSAFIKEYRYKNFNIYKMINIGYCFITNNSHNISDTPTYEDVVFIKSELELDDNYEIIFHFNNVFGIVILRNGERLFSKQLHEPDCKEKLKTVSAFFDDIKPSVFGFKPIYLD